MKGNSVPGCNIDKRPLSLIGIFFIVFIRQDILENDDIKLEAIFIASMVNDLVKGMMNLHKTDLHFHGNLKSSNCVVTSRWVLQITDYGLHELRAAAEKDFVGEHEHYRSKLKLRRHPNDPRRIVIHFVPFVKSGDFTDPQLLEPNFTV